MAVHTISTEAELIAFKDAGGVLSALDIIVHKKTPHYIMSALLLKHFPATDYRSVNAGTSLYTRFGHDATVVVSAT